MEPVLDELESRASRQAIHTLRGYAYQVWQSLHMWINLKEGQILVLEGAEDIDLLSIDSAEVNQIKYTSSVITLNSPNVLESIVHFWEHKTKNPDRVILFRYVTSSTIGKEKSGIKQIDCGLEFWEESDKGSPQLSNLREFLLLKLKEIQSKEKNIKTSDQKENLKIIPSILDSLIKFLEKSKNSEFYDHLVSKIRWVTSALSLEEFEDFVSDQLFEYGEKRNILPSDSENIDKYFLSHIWETLCQGNPRKLTRRDFGRLFEQYTRVSVSRSEMEIHRNNLIGNLQSIVENSTKLKSPLPYLNIKFIDLEEKIDFSRIQVRAIEEIDKEKTLNDFLKSQITEEELSVIEKHSNEINNVLRRYPDGWIMRPYEVKHLYNYMKEIDESVKLLNKDFNTFKRRYNLFQRSIELNNPKLPELGDQDDEFPENLLIKLSNDGDSPALKKISVKIKTEGRIRFLKWNELEKEGIISYQERPYEVNDVLNAAWILEGRIKGIFYPYEFINRKGQVEGTFTPLGESLKFGDYSLPNPNYFLETTRVNFEEGEISIRIDGDLMHNHYQTIETKDIYLCSYLEKGEIGKVTYTCHTYNSPQPTTGIIEVIGS